MKAWRTFWKGALTLATLVLAIGFGPWLWEHRPNPPRLSAARLHAPQPDTPPALPVNNLLRTNLPPEELPASLPDSPDRVADARTRHGGVIKGRFIAAGINYPPAEVFIRIFKYEGQIELWAKNTPAKTGPFGLVHTFPILRASGRLGPKRQEGDCQVPEGFYSIDRFNPRSLFHLSLGLDYPNASDRILTTDPEQPGSDVFIHGDCQSIGCLAMGDPVIEEIFLAAWDAKQHGQSRFAVHVFPCRMDETTRATILTPACRLDPGLESFWQNLQEGYDAFEQTRRIPIIQVQGDGSYTVVRSGGR